MKSQDGTERELWRQTRDKYTDYPYWHQKEIFKALLQKYRCIQSLKADDSDEPILQQIIKEGESRNQDNLEMQISEIDGGILQYYYENGLIVHESGDLYGYDNADDIDEIIASVDSTEKKAWFIGRKDSFCAGGYIFCLDIEGQFPKNTSEKTSKSGKKKRDR